jgi:hypothetical protein
MLTKTQKLYLTEDEEVVAAWEECWENILRLPLEARLTSELVADAERLACICRSRTRDKAIAWLKKEVEDAQGYVGEQLAIDPDDAEWQRIQGILAGAQAGLAADLHPDRLDNEGKPEGLAGSVATA